MNLKKLLAFVLTWVLGIAGTSAGMVTVFAANPWDGMVETSVLEKVTDTTNRVGTDGTFDGYIQTVQGADLLNSSYIKVTYTVTGTVTDDTEIFTVQPFDTAWGGWNDNKIKIGDSILSDGVYTAYLSVADVKASLTSGTLKGINISFLENSGYDATLTGYYYLAPETEDPGVMTDKKRLKLSLDYCAGMDESKYQPDSWSTFQKAVTTAQSVYNSSVADTKYASARADLEKAKSKLLFVDSTESSNPMDFRIISGDNTIYEMGVGWNLGNTMDGHTGFHPAETAWQSVVTTQEIIKAVHDAGFNTVRVPVTWGDMIDDENGYAINDAWINRVQDIVDYCTSLDMYTIINIHHDGAEQDGWLRVAADDIDKVYEKFECVWRHIAEHFKDYDEHLIFESANELTCMEGSDKNSSAAITKDTPVIVNLNQIFVNVVRSTGSNNTKRWLSAVSHYANGGTQSGFALPTDYYNSSNRLMFSAHIYKSSTKTSWTYSEVYEVVSALTKMVKKHKVPIILGEYGNRNKMNSANPSGYNDIDRAWFDEIVTRACQVGKVVPCVWDQGWFDLTQKPDSTFSVWNREGNAPIFKTITDAMMRGVYLTPSSKNKSYDMTDIAINPAITNITDISLSDANIDIEYGDSVTVSAEVQPLGTNDVLLWKSSDDSVATVSRGMIRGRKIGYATITAFSQSGSKEAEMTVRVLPKNSDKQITSILTDSESYQVMKDKYVNMSVSAEPADNTDSLIYSSSNPRVATINPLGKIVGVSAGQTYITVMSSSGITKTVPVTVTESSSDESIELAANVYYNDSLYAANEIGTPIKVKGDGQYTVSFDTATDLSDKAKTAGIKYLKNLTSVYIKDNAVATGQAVKSPLDSCDIRYDSIKLDGVSLTITKTDFKSALKENSVFDTNDPINGWDGSAVKEVSSSNHTVNFTSSDTPSKIEITFTLQNLKFTPNSSDDSKPAEKHEAVSEKRIVLNAGDNVDIKTKITPADSTSLVTFVSSDESVAMVKDNAVSADNNGVCTAKFTALREGSAKITAVTDNGLTVEFDVTVGSMAFSNAKAVIDGGKVTSVTADMNYAPESDILAVVCVYDADGRMSVYDSKPVGLDNMSNGKLTVSGFDIPVSDGQTAKAFIWNSFEQMIPLSD